MPSPALRMLRASLFVGFAVSASACATALTPTGRLVKVSDERMVAQCKYLGDVEGGSSTTNSARNDARNDAADIGATNIVFVSQAPGIPGKTESDTLGRAYKCAGDTAADKGAPPTLAPSY